MCVLLACILVDMYHGKVTDFLKLCDGGVCSSGEVRMNSQVFLASSYSLRVYSSVRYF